MKKMEIILGGLLSLVILIQIGWIYPTTVRELGQIRANIGKDGLWRSAYFHRNLRFANFIEFL
jgi:hypothetical protein